MRALLLGAADSSSSRLPRRWRATRSMASRFGNTTITKDAGRDGNPYLLRTPITPSPAKQGTIGFDQGHLEDRRAARSA